MNFAFLKRNQGYKIFSLLVATLLYYVANAQQNPRVTRDVFVQPEVVKLPQNIVVKDPPAPFPISLSGPETLMNKVSAQTIKVTVDGSSAKPGSNRLPVVIALPPGVQSAANAPQALAQFIAEKKDQKDYGVDVIFAGTPPPGQEYSEPIATPNSVTVQGLSDDLKRVGRIVANVQREDNELAVERIVQLAAEDLDHRRIDSVDITPAQVKVRVNLHPVPTTKTMLLSIEFNGKPAPGYRIATYDIVPNQIVVRGAIEAISSRSSITLPVDVSGISESVTKTVTIALPSGIRPQEALPPVKIHLDVRPIPALDGGTREPIPSPSPAATPTPQPIREQETQ